MGAAGMDTYPLPQNSKRRGKRSKGRKGEKGKKNNNKFKSNSNKMKL